MPKKEIFKKVTHASANERQKKHRKQLKEKGIQRIEFKLPEETIQQVRQYCKIHDINRHEFLDNLINEFMSIYLQKKSKT